MQRGEELGAGGRAGVVRKGRQAEQALAETGQVAAGERLGVLAWGPGKPWCGRREDRRAGRGPSGVEGRGGARRSRGQTGAQAETGGRMDVQRRAARETQRQTRAGVVSLAWELGGPLPQAPARLRARPFPGPSHWGCHPPSSHPPLLHPPRCTRGLHPASLPQVAHGELQYLCFLQLRVPEVLQAGGGAQRQKKKRGGERGGKVARGRREGRIRELRVPPGLATERGDGQERFPVPTLRRDCPT